MMKREAVTILDSENPQSSSLISKST